MAGGGIPRVACFARNPGLGNRNTYSVAAACVSPSPNPPQGAGVPHQAPFQPSYSLPQGEGAPTAGLSQPSSRGRSSNCKPIPAFFKGIEFQLRPHPSLPQGDGALPKYLRHSEMELPPLGEGWGGAQMELPPLGEGWGGAQLGAPAPWGGLGRGSCWDDSRLLPPAMPLEDYLPMTNSRVPPAMMSA